MSGDDTRPAGVRWAPAWNHAQEDLQVGDRAARIDRLIVPLIEALWRHDIATTASCEDNAQFPQDGPRVWVAFADATDASAFLDLVCAGAGADDDLARRVRAPAVNPLDSDVALSERTAAWYLSATPVDMGIELEEREEGTAAERRTAPPRFAIEVDVRFPASDLEEVTRRLHRALAAERARGGSAAGPGGDPISP